MKCKRGTIIGVFAILIASLLIAMNVAAIPATTWSTLNSTKKPQSGETTANTRFPVPDRAIANPPFLTANYIWDEASTNGRLLYMPAFGTQSKWTEILPSQTYGYPTPREGACLVWSGANPGDFGMPGVDQNLILFGGKLSNGQYTNEVNIYNMWTRNWEYKQSLPYGPTPRAWSACARYQSYMVDQPWPTYEFNGMIIDGGWGPNGYESGMWIFCDHPYDNPGESDRDGCPAPFRGWRLAGPIIACDPILGIRSGHAFVELNHWTGAFEHNTQYDELIVFGGIKQGGQSNDYVREPTHLKFVEILTGGVLAFDCVTWGESFEPYTPWPRQAFGVAIKGSPSGASGMVIYGGSGPNGLLNDAYYAEWDSALVVHYKWITQSGTLPGNRRLPAFMCAGLNCLDTDATWRYILYGGWNGVNKQDTFKGNFVP